MNLQVTAKSMVASGIFCFEFRAATGEPLPAFTAGAHITLKTPNGSQRQYSLCNAPDQLDHYRIAVKREEAGRGGSRSLCDDVETGHNIEVSAPVNHFELDSRAQQYILIAGGIGITPMLSMAQFLAGQDKDFRLYYLTRDTEGTAFRQDLMDAEFAQRVILHHDQGRPENGLDLWPVLEKPGSLHGRHVYCCGPTGLMESVRDMTGHWPGNTVHFESFGVASSARDDDVRFTVELRKSGLRLDVPPGQSILDVARAAGIQMPSSCESGTCGSCKTRLVDGTADHRDHVLLPEEQSEWIMPCVSRAHSSSLALDA